MEHQPTANPGDEDQVDPQATGQLPSPGTVPIKIVVKPARLCAGFTDLPIDVLITIVGYVIEDDGALEEGSAERRRYLRRLGKTCQCLHHASLHFLYRVVATKRGRPGKYHNEKINQVRVNLPRLVRLFHGLGSSADATACLETDNGCTLVASHAVDEPEPCALVRHIDLDHGSNAELVFGDPVYHGEYVGGAMKQFLGKELDPKTPRTVRKWYQWSSVPVTLLLCMTTNLTSAHFNVGPKWDICSLAVKQPDGTWLAKQTFPNLRILALTGLPNVERPWSLEEGVLPSLLAVTPNLDCLKLIEIGGVHGIFTLPPRTTSLHLKDTTLFDSQLEHIGRTSPQLKRFRDNRERRDMQGRMRPYFHALLPVTDQLLSLELPDFPNLDTKKTWEFMDRVARFSAMKVLGLTYGADHRGFGSTWLSGLVERCPGLEGLVVTSADTIEYTQMIALAEAVAGSGSPGSLRKVWLVVGRSSETAYYSLAAWRMRRAFITRESLSSIFRAGGIEFSVCSREEWTDTGREGDKFSETKRFLAETTDL